MGTRRLQGRRHQEAGTKDATEDGCGERSESRSWPGAYRCLLPKLAYLVTYYLRALEPRLPRQTLVSESGYLRKGQ